MRKILGVLCLLPLIIIVLGGIYVMIITKDFAPIIAFIIGIPIILLTIEGIDLINKK
jgi:hypothetical protein